MRKASKDRLDRFNNAAQNWGWQRDQGCGASVTAAQTEYQSAKAELIKRIEYLEKQSSKVSRSNSH